jgi:CHAT domain-containing protein/Tfp pilus assembly protein PilF
VPALVAALALGCAAGPQPASAPQAAPAAAKAEAQALSPGAILERTLPPGGRDEIPLDLQEGAYIRFFFDSTDLYLDVQLLGPSGEPVARAESSQGHLSAIATAAGRYRLAVAPLNPKAGGPYRLIVEELRPSREGDADRVKADAGLAAAIRLEAEDKPDQGAEKAREALDLYRKVQDPDGQFEAWNEIGSAYSLKKEKDSEAATLLAYQKGLEVAEAAGNRRNQARVLTSLGLFLIRPQTASGAEKAQTYLERALPLWEELGDSYHQSLVLYHLAIGRYLTGRLDEAIELYQKALPLTQSAILTTRIWNGIGNAYSARGESRKALESFDTALKIAEDGGDRGAEATALTSAGNIYQRRGEPQRAFRNFQSAFEINQQDPDLQPAVGKVLLQIGSVNMDLGQTEEAFAAYQRALESSQGSEGAWVMANALWSIGRVDRVRGNPRDALEHLGKGLEIAVNAKIDRTQAAIHHEIGVTQLDLRQFPEAVSSLEKALPLRQKTDRLGEALTRQALGKAWLEQGSLPRAGSFLDEALKIADDVGAPLIRSSIHYDLARLRRREARLPDALSEIKTAIALLEAVRSDLSEDRLRTSFFASRRPYYDFLVDLLMELERREPGRGYEGEALRASEKGHARGLLDLLSQGRVELTRGIDPDLRRREAEVNARLSQIQSSLVEERSDTRKGRAPVISTLSSSLQEALREQRDVETEIETRSPRYYQLRYPSSLGPTDVQRLLPSRDSVLLEYFLGEQGSYLFVVTAGGLTAHPLSLSAEEISREIGRIETGFKPGGLLSFAYKQAAYRLYQTLIAPAREELAGKRHLLIVPDGALSALPFEALLTRPAQGGAAGLRYLLYDFSVSYIPSASVLSSLSLQRPAVAVGGTALRFVAFAPDYGPAQGQEQVKSASGSVREAAVPGSSELPELVGARDEVQEIARRYPPNTAKVFLGRDASRENVQKGPLISDHIHFAGHGLTNDEHPEDSALVMSDGLLRVSDIFNLELKTDLVVLSACRTAGKQVAGEGLVGLTRAFLYAGSPSVVVTLWQVVDSSTSDLMRGFYESLDQTRDKAEALRQAKIRIIQRQGRLALPYSWAPFILVGGSQ